jgi:hypothetical protein
MAAIDRISGDRGQIKVDPAGGGAVVAVASINKWTLSLAKELYKVTAFGDTNQVYTPGLPDISGNVSGFWDTTDRSLFTIALGTVAPFLHLIPNTLAPTYLFKGLAYLDASIDVGSGGAVTIAGQFKAAGPWVMAP